jgi:hypothetical protein
VFSFFLGSSAAAVVALNEAARVPYDRVVSAVAIRPA